ncbi:GNAT family N-acetyltransferase [Bacteroides thetaiotaomicron]|uniref:GNAT family N-acetyltransferase n=1 Tax=Bacteroides TaxID=816 RepID=UPI0012AC447D|nr:MULTISPECIES: GNAT family N-acetyltransferase [Bacteroides]MCE9137718.1 GNAT family N-acetyltransferase [Bacteroides thetaiotaomicron]
MIIRKVEVNENRALAKLHMQVMPDFFLASLGEGFLTTYYKVVLRYPETICLLAEDENKNILGFVLGREKAKGYLKRILKSSLFTFVIEGIKLLFIKPKSLIRLVRNLDKISKDSSISDTQNYAEIGLIGVSPELKGQGIGHKLFEGFIGILKERNVANLSLTTDMDDNEQTITSYKAWGFTVMYEFKTYPDRRMLRLIKEI